MLTKLRRDSTLENDVDGTRFISIFRSSDFSARFRPTSAPEGPGDVSCPENYSVGLTHED